MPLHGMRGSVDEVLPAAPLHIRMTVSLSERHPSTLEVSWKLVSTPASSTCCVLGVDRRIGRDDREHGCHRRRKHRCTFRHSPDRHLNSTARSCAALEASKQRFATVSVVMIACAAAFPLRGCSEC